MNFVKFIARDFEDILHRKSNFIKGTCTFSGIILTREKWSWVVIDVIKKKIILRFSLKFIHLIIKSTEISLCFINKHSD